jgi:tRNA A37 methylthiotransferase MiaB
MYNNCVDIRIMRWRFFSFFLLQGYDIVQNKELADVWLLNSCTVKNPAEEGGIVLDNEY